MMVEQEDDSTCRLLAQRSAWMATDDHDDDVSRQYYEAENALHAGHITGHGRRALAWAIALRAYESFWATNGVTARENTRNRSTLPPEERRMGEWARYQRRYRGALCAYQQCRLDASLAFDWDPQQAAWDRHLRACIEHRRETGRLPQVGAHRPQEHTHARWLNRQLALAQTRQLPGNRVAKLNDFLDRARNTFTTGPHRRRNPPE